MSTRLVVDKESHLKEMTVPEKPRYAGLVRMLATIISYLFHPLFIPLYITFFLLKIHGFLFGGISEWERMKVFMQMFVNCTFLPFLSIMLLRGLKFINSIYLPTQRDRIIPFVISMIFYFWNWYAFKNNHEAREIVSLSLGIFISSILGFLANIYMKISMHAIAAGVMVAFMAALALQESSNLNLYFSLSVLLAGAVCTSRLIVSDHTPREVYTGLLIGVTSQLLGIWL